jgi:hypothetical protein
MLKENTFRQTPKTLRQANAYERLLLNILKCLYYKSFELLNVIPMTLIYPECFSTYFLFPQTGINNQLIDSDGANLFPGVEDVKAFSVEIKIQVNNNQTTLRSKMSNGKG